MAETFDVTVAGAGYMVKPGAYARFQDGQSEGRVGRVRVFDFYGGGRRAVQLERDKFYRSLGVGPDLDSQGISSRFKRQDRTENPVPAIVPGNKRWTFWWAGKTYLIEGAEVYEVAVAGGLYNGLTAKRALAATVVDCAQDGQNVYLAYGAAADAAVYNMSTNVLTASTFGAGVKAYLMGQFGGIILYTAAADTSIISKSGGGTNSVDGPIRRFVQHDGRAWIFTTHSLVDYDGAVGYQASLPRLGYADDVAWAVSHMGQLWTWIGKEVVRYTKPKDLNNAQAVFTTVGLRGLSTLGACSVGNWLIVAVVSEITGFVELWAYDGRGWWLLDEQTSAGTKYSYPVSVLGVADDADVFAGRGATNQDTAIWQLVPRTGVAGLPASGELVTAMLDAGQRDLLKVWRRAGCEIAIPDGRATADSVTVTLSYSTDGGANWTQVATANYTNASGRILNLSGAISALPQARFLQLKLAFSSVLDWCPVVVGLWTEHETLDTPSRRRRWRFTVLCKDQVVKRDGSIATTGARQLALNLWNAWDDGGVVTFKDVDYDLTTTTYNVRIAGIREQVVKVQDAATFADSEVELTLVEV